MPENERIQQRKNLIDRRQDKSDDSELPQILKVPVESSHLSEAAVPRTTLDDLSREPLLDRRFQAQDTAAIYGLSDCEDDPAEGAALNEVTQSIRRFSQRERLCHDGLDRPGLKQ